MSTEVLDSRLRVLIVDDSAVVRSLLQKAVEREPGFVVVGTARDGEMAIERCRELRPDVVTLDVEMPVLDGLGALPKLLEVQRELTVIMVSSLTSRGARVTVSALLNGAFDYITKPAQMESREAALTQLSALLSPKLQAAAFRKRVSAPAPRVVSVAHSLAPRLSRPPRHNEHRVLAIGSSTGGPAALAQLLGGLPPGFALPIVIAQHMPETFTRLLAERLSEVSQFKVREAIAGETLRSGEAWIAPGNFHLTVAQSRGSELYLGVNSDAPVNCCRPSIDVLLQSLSVSAGRHTLAVLLTGMGHDGRDGAKALRSAGGEVLAQDEASSVVWGIPGAVVAAGLANAVVPITDMAREVAVRTRSALAKAGT